MINDILRRCNLLGHPQINRLNFLLNHIMEYSQLFF
jgi:hypothetical protein